MVMALGLSGTSLRKTPWVNGRCPVSNDARVGEQTGKPATALINRTLSDARRSRFGVLTLGSPANPNACARHWSASTITMFGLRSAARAGFDAAKIRNRIRTSIHEPNPLIPSFSPNGGEGARRAVEGDSAGFMERIPAKFGGELWP